MLDLLLLLLLLVVVFGVKRELLAFVEWDLLGALSVELDLLRLSSSSANSVPPFSLVELFAGLRRGCAKPYLLKMNRRVSALASLGLLGSLPDADKLELLVVVVVAAEV